MMPIKCGSLNIENFQKKIYFQISFKNNAYYLNDFNGQ